MKIKDTGDKQDNPISPEMQSVKQTLQVDEDKEKDKKKMRKDLENKALEEQMKETPDIEVTEDLANETPVEAPLPPAPAKPIAPPKAV